MDALLATELEKKFQRIIHRSPKKNAVTLVVVPEKL